ncbi:MAG: AAA-like domain-containing protein [Cyanobacteria bacterium P01_D01_bin.44]
MDDVLTKRILILAANPKNSNRLRLDEEVREIEEGLTRSKKRHQFELIQKWAVRPRDVQRAFLEVSPYIVHFSGHGVGDNGLALEDETGQIKFVTAEALASLFKLFATEVKCVLLNACYSKVQAKAIAQHIPYVIGMNQSVGDKAALTFSVGFYDALGAGKSIEFAYKFACNAIHMAGIDEYSTPILRKSSSQASSIYVDRPPTEEMCYAAVLRSGLSRIQAPPGMGKTMLLQKIMMYASEQQSYQTAILDFSLVEQEVYSNLDTFLKQFCSNITFQLDLEDKIEELWSSSLGSVYNCHNYFKGYVLKRINSPIILGLEQIHLLFSYPEISSPFFGLLRGFHNERDISLVFQKLRIITTHSQEAALSSNVNQSPFHVGSVFHLREFNESEVQELIRQSGITLTVDEVQLLMAMVGGNPHLLWRAISNIAIYKTPLEEILQEAPTEQGVYANHLRRYLLDLQRDQDLLKAYIEVINSAEPIRLDPFISLRLTGMGLTKSIKDKVVVACELYRSYFQKQLCIS